MTDTKIMQMEEKEQYIPIITPHRRRPWLARHRAQIALLVKMGLAGGVIVVMFTMWSLLE